VAAKEAQTAPKPKMQPSQRPTVAAAQPVKAQAEKQKVVTKSVVATASDKAATKKGKVDKKRTTGQDF
jgi:hypothetical protein